jgi:hypothetical protein
MAENAAASRHTELRPLSEVNREPGGQTISTVVRIVHAVIKPLTKRDWRYQDKVPQTGGAIFVANHISNADPLAVGQVPWRSPGAGLGSWQRRQYSRSPWSGASSLPVARFRFSARPHIPRTR